MIKKSPMRTFVRINLFPVKILSLAMGYAYILYKSSIRLFSSELNQVDIFSCRVENKLCSGTGYMYMDLSFLVYLPLSNLKYIKDETTHT